MWLDCDWVFDEDGTLSEIRPHGGGTVDQLRSGANVADAKALYGPAVSATAGVDGVITSLFTASAERGTAWKVRHGNAAGDDGVISTVYLCKCLAQTGTSRSQSVAPAPTSPVAEPRTGGGPGGGAATQTIVVQPITRGNQLASGWTVVDEGAVGSCSSRTGEDRAVERVDCGGGADAFDGCWMLDSSTVLCARDPFEKKLYQRTVQSWSEYGGSAPAESLNTVELADGSTFHVRHGSGNRPSNGKSADYSDMYYAASGGKIIWGIYDGGFGRAFDRTGPVWTAEVGDETGPNTVKDVKAVYTYGPKS